MPVEDRRQRLLRLAYYACAIYAVTAAALLHWRIDESILGYDPDHDNRAIRVFFLLVMSGFSVLAGRSVNIDRSEATGEMLRKFGIEAYRFSESEVILLVSIQIAGLVVICSVIFLAR